MTKQQAIRALSQQRSSLGDSDSLKNLIWLGQTKDYFSTLFGKDSERYTLVDSFHSYSNAYIVPDQEKDIADSKNKLQTILSNAIESVHNGAYIKDPNFLMRFTNKDLITGIIGAGTILVTLTAFIMKAILHCPTNP